MNIILELKNIYFSVFKSEKGFNKKTSTEILHNINLNIYNGEILGISGESGGGKTTLAKIIAVVLKPSQGEIVWNKEILSANTNNSPVQILFQNHGEILNPYRKVDDIVNEALKIQGLIDASLKLRKEEIYASLNLAESIYKKRGYELSGGEQQRTALARILAANPKILILDEPFSAQDVEQQLSLLNLLKKINEDFHLTIICISHDLNILKKLVNRIIIIKEGKITEEGRTEDIFNNPVHPYTKYLLKAKNLSLNLSELNM